MAPSALISTHPTNPLGSPAPHPRLTLKTLSGRPPPSASDAVVSCERGEPRFQGQHPGGSSGMQVLRYPPKNSSQGGTTGGNEGQITSSGGRAQPFASHTPSEGAELACESPSLKGPAARERSISGRPARVREPQAVPAHKGQGRRGPGTRCRPWPGRKPSSPLAVRPVPGP